MNRAQWCELGLNEDMHSYFERGWFIGYRVERVLKGPGYEVIAGYSSLLPTIPPFKILVSGITEERAEVLVVTLTLANPDD